MAQSIAELQRGAMAIKAQVLSELGIADDRAAMEADIARLASAGSSGSKRVRAKEAAAPSRKSGRLATLPGVSMNEDALAASAEAAREAAAAEEGAGGVPSSVREPRSGNYLTSAPDADSTMGLPSRFPWLSDRFLGRFLPTRFSGLTGNQAKRAVMQAACGRGSGRQVKFSKYSGCPAFRDGIVLFVNMTAGAGGGSGRDDKFVNTLHEGGRRVVWFPPANSCARAQKCL